MIRITRRRALALGSTALLLPSALRAQAAWPIGPVTFVVGYSAGGSSDINARELAHIMSPIIGQQIVVDNKGGATGSIGLRAVANAKPDGYTLFFAVGTNVVINPHVQKGMIDTLASLAPICQTNSSPAKTPDAILDKIEKDAKSAMKDPKWAEALARDGLELPPDRTRAEFAKFVADEHAYWGKKLKVLKIEME